MTAAVDQFDASAPAALSAVHIEHLTHTYPVASRSAGPARPALDQVSFDVRQGEVFGVLGPNGGGKSTLFRILCTLLRPTSGRVTVLGHDALAHPHQVRAMLGVVFQSPSLDAKLTAGENLMHQGHLYGLSGATLRQRAAELLGYFGLADRAGERVERFSGGMRRRVEIAKAMLHHPRLLLLDEPSTGLDPGARADVWRILVKLRDDHGVTVALTTHFMEEADRCDRLAILAAGKLIALDTPGKLKAAIRGDVITLEPVGPPEGPTADELCAAITQRFGPWPEGAVPRVADGRIYLEKPDGPAFVAAIAGQLSGKVRSITVGRATLDDVFMHLTGRALADESADDISRHP